MFLLRKPMSHSNYMNSNKLADTLICHTITCRNAINVLHIPGHMILWCLEVVLVAYASDVVPWKNMSELARANACWLLLQYCLCVGSSLHTVLHLYIQVLILPYRLHRRASLPTNKEYLTQKYAISLTSYGHSFKFLLNMLSLLCLWHILLEGSNLIHYSKIWFIIPRHFVLLTCWSS